jgi:hypothetical protein
MHCCIMGASPRPWPAGITMCSAQDGPTGWVPCPRLFAICAAAAVKGVKIRIVSETIPVPAGRSVCSSFCLCMQGECDINPKYMVGNGEQLKGYCRLSCGTCTPTAASGRSGCILDAGQHSLMRGCTASHDCPSTESCHAPLCSFGCCIYGFNASCPCWWGAGLPEEQEAKLEEVSAKLLSALEEQACEEREVCSGLSGQAHRAMDTAMASPAEAGVAAATHDAAAKR